MFEVDIYAERYRGMTRQEQTACLTGHRIIPPGEEQKIMIRAKNIIRKLIWEKNVRYFGVGGAVGFDMLATEYLIHLRAHGEHQIKIISRLHELPQLYRRPGCNLHALFCECLLEAARVVQGIGYVEGPLAHRHASTWERGHSFDERKIATTTLSVAKQRASRRRNLQPIISNALSAAQPDQGRPRTHS